MTFLSNSLYSQKRPFRKDNSSKSLISPKLKINSELPESPEILPVNKITEIPPEIPPETTIEIPTESRDLVLCKKEVSILKENSLKYVYESLGQKLEQEKSERELKIKTLRNSLEVSKSEKDKIQLDFSNFQAQKTLENAANYKMLQSFFSKLKEVSELIYSHGYVKEFEEIAKRIHRNEAVILKFGRKFRQLYQRNSRLLKDVTKTTEKLENSERNCRNLDNELEFQQNSNQKLQIAFDNAIISKEKEIGKVKEQLEVTEKEFKLEKLEISREFKNELKELKESHQTEKEELKLQIATENLQKRSAEDEILKLKTENQSIVSNLEAEITKLDVNLTIKNERLQEFKEKIECLQTENSKLKESKQEVDLTVARVSNDLELSRKEKNQLFTDYKLLESKYSEIDSSILNLNKLLDQASNIIQNGLLEDDKMDFSGLKGVQNTCVETLLNSIGKTDSCRVERIESLESKNHELITRTTKYDQDLEALTTQNILLETKIEENCGKLKSAQDQVEDLRLKILDLETKNTNLLKEKSKLEEVCAKQKTSQISADDLSEKFLAEITNLKKDLDTLEKEKSKLALELDVVRNGNETSLSEAREKWKDTMFAREAEFKNQLKQKEMIIKEKELLIGKFQNIGTPISSSKTVKTERSLISPLKFKSVLKIEEMEDQTLIDIPMDEFVDDSPKMSLRKKPRKTRNTASAQEKEIVPGTSQEKKLPPWNRSKPVKSRKDVKKSGTALKRSGSISSFPSVLDENSLFDLH